MNCPQCSHPVTGVKDSRAVDDGAGIRRRRNCAQCGTRFTTVELTLPAWMLTEDEVTNVGRPKYTVHRAIDFITAFGAMDFKDREIIMEVVRRFGAAS
jgi:transcriptional regulator NrdR family protein